MKDTETVAKIQKAPKLLVDQWIDENGKERGPVSLEDYKDTFKVIYCFQDWCPGCHKKGLPDLQKMVNALKDKKDVAFFAIQTVFEGHEQNSYDKIKKVQAQYDLQIPFGHDPGDASSNFTSKTMRDFKTGGTPWFLWIDKHNNIVFSDFHLNVDAAIEVLQKHI